MGLKRERSFEFMTSIRLWLKPQSLHFDMIFHIIEFITIISCSYFCGFWKLVNLMTTIQFRIKYHKCITINQNEFSFDFFYLRWFSIELYDFQITDQHNNFKTIFAVHFEKHNDQYRMFSVNFDNKTVFHIESIII